MSDENDDKQIIETDGVDETAGADLQTSSEEDEQPTQLGAARYVFAAFFAGGLLIAYLAGMMTASIWGMFADWRAATSAMPWLLQVAEDERTNYTLPFGAIIGIIVITYGAVERLPAPWPISNPIGETWSAIASVALELGTILEFA